MNLTNFYSTIDELSENEKPIEERQENYKEKFIEKFSNLKLGQNNRIQYLLRNIGNHLRGDISTLLDDELTLEHVLPFSYRAHWANVDFKDIDAGDQAGLQPRKLNYKHDGQTLHDAYVDRIGNHTLLASSDNTSISNLDFETKKRDCFESASLNITRNMNNNDEMKNISLCGYSDWNSTSIEKDQKHWQILHSKSGALILIKAFSVKKRNKKTDFKRLYTNHQFIFLSTTSTSNLLSLIFLSILHHPDLT